MLTAAGLSFDLTPLTKADGDYTLKDGAYDYYINVCAPASHCSNDAAGGCQKKTGDA